MEDYEIRLVFFWYEIKKKYKAIIIAGLIGALLLCAYKYVSIKKSMATPQYASNLVVEMVEDHSETENKTTVNNTEANSARITSDAVLTKVLADLSADYPDETVDSLRDTIFCHGKANGDIMYIYVVAETQEQANAISKSMESNVPVYAATNSETLVSVIHTTSNMGVVTLEESDDDDDPEQNVIKAETTSFGASTAIKWGLIGLVVGIFAGIAYVCIVFLCKDKLVYEPQIRDIGVNSFGKIKLGDKSISNNAVAGLIMAYTKDSGKTEILPYGCSAAEITETIGANLKDATVTEDILQKPEGRMTLSDGDNVVMAVKSDSIGLEDLLTEKQNLENIGANVLGAFLVED